LEEYNVDSVNALHKILKPFILRRTKDEVERTIPPKKEIYLHVGLS
jgi:SWI/SNF-related matrix-associated actin-dependent regulator of chromatin subfamily A member 5